MCLTCYFFSKYSTFAHLFKFCTIFQTLIVEKDSGSVWKNIKPNFPYRSTNSTFFVSKCSFLSYQSDSTNDCSVTSISHNKPLPVSNVTTTNQVINYCNNYDNTQSFAAPRKKIISPLKYLKELLQIILFGLMFITVYTKWVLQLQQYHRN